MPKINVHLITQRQKLKIITGLYMYQYISDNWRSDDEDFRDVFTDFYLSSQGKMRNDDNRIPFFNKLQDCDPTINLVDLMCELYDEMGIKKYEFSFATKLLHTKNTDSPIYDSKVREYLKRNEGVDFWLYFRTPRNDTEKIEFIRHDWNLLVEWYNVFMRTPRAVTWIEWFDHEFPDFIHIPSKKKIDFIIFACN